MNLKEKAKKFKEDYIEELTQQDKKEFIFILNQYQCALNGKTQLYYDILLNLSTIDFLGRNSPSALMKIHFVSD